MLDMVVPEFIRVVVAQEVIMVEAVAEEATMAAADLVLGPKEFLSYLMLHHFSVLLEDQ
jgi:hypothetical protein